MSRTFGDRMGHACGIICTPEIIEYKMDKNVRCIVLGSDGIFEVLPNSILLQVTTKHLAKRNADAAAEELLEKSVIKWRNKANYQDDITVVVQYINTEVWSDMNKPKNSVQEANIEQKDGEKS